LNSLGHGLEDSENRIEIGL